MTTSWLGRERTRVIPARLGRASDLPFAPWRQPPAARHGGLLAARFILVLNSLENLNQTLETRVADRERHLAANYVKMTTMQEQAAAAQERQLIMREIHDELGSRLFTSLSRVERGDMDKEQIAATLRDCIADMRLAGRFGTGRCGFPRSPRQLPVPLESSAGGGPREVELDHQRA